MVEVVNLDVKIFPIIPASLIFYNPDHTNNVRTIGLNKKYFRFFRMSIGRVYFEGISNPNKMLRILL